MARAPRSLLERSSTHRYQDGELRSGLSAEQSAGVLIVVADRLVGRRLARLLTGRGYAGVRAVSSASRALILAHAHDPGIIFLDLELSDEAYDLARVLRQQTRHDAHRLIALTPAIEQSTRERARRAGFERWLVTPVVQSELEDLLLEQQTLLTE
ncbi:MAG TPA: response regulator [Steroidobacteraceae bacterium]|nr:response regulator [Steroidobacteraceae bacterium]